MALDINNDCSTVSSLFSLSLVSMVNEAAYPLAILIEISLISKHLSPESLAAYSATSSTVSFAMALFHFLVTVKLIHHFLSLSFSFSLTLSP